VDAVVLSLWRDDDCVGEFRMAAEDILEFVRVLVEGLVEAGARAAPPGGSAHARHP